MFSSKIDKQGRKKFISILKHDIKTPIIAQIQALKLILDKDTSNLTVIQREILKETLNSNYFLYEIILNTIFMENFENNKTKPYLEEIDILKEVREICQNFQNQAKEKSQNLIIKSNKNIQINADKKYIRKIIHNIILGSISFGLENNDIEITIDENEKSIDFLAKNKTIYMTKEKINTLIKNKNEDVDFNQLGMMLNFSVADKLINAHNWKTIIKSGNDNLSIFGFSAEKIH